MAWVGQPPSSSVPRDVAGPVRRALADGAEEVRAALAAGAPVDSGALRDSFAVTPTADGFEVGSPLPYAPYVDIDTSGAERAVTDTDAAIVRGVDSQFGG